ncbi:MAG: beta-glucuronidase [Fastidiosipilaceae bacterium]|jgi:beta-glucuronidase
MLYPIRTQTRYLESLDGIWQLRFEKDGYKADPSKPLTGGYSIAVPGSFNDQLTIHELRHFAGYMVYEREFFVDANILAQRPVLRFGSVTHNCEVFINGKLVAEHRGGFTPFEADLTDQLELGSNRVTVRVNNLLDHSTLPVGNLKTWEDEDGNIYYKVDENFDFFNYAGIHRPVKLYTTPKQWIRDLSLVSEVSGADAVVKIKTDAVDAAELKVVVRAKDAEGNVVAIEEGNDCSLHIDDVKLWEPGAGYLYDIEVELQSDDGSIVDQYILPYGIRTIEVKGYEFLINGKPFYFKGYGKHEDYPLHGRGFDEVANVLDLNRLKWSGANSFRTSHYPYSEEMMRLCDREGIVVIDETSAVGLMENFNFNLDDMASGSTWEVMDTAEAHRQVLTELIERDKNHACVVMWSIANEAATSHPGAREYFEPLFNLAWELDPEKRPRTIVNIMVCPPEMANAEGLGEVLCLNRYQGWYAQTGDLAAGAAALRDELVRWEKLFPKMPIIFTEYGADTVAGLHAIDDIPFTEEYQVRFYHTYHKIFDEFESIIGEQLWNFADFETKVGVNRVKGNKKGVFTRDREPKMSTHILRRRWLNIPDFNYDKKQSERDKYLDNF